MKTLFKTLEHLALIPVSIGLVIIMFIFFLAASFARPKWVIQGFIGELGQDLPNE